MQRLFEIVYILLQKKTVTAIELAERFEVSTRTIYRDIDALSAAGIPVYAKKGRFGGISLMDGFVLNSSVLSEREQTGILAALQGLQATEYQGAEEVLDKLSRLFHREPPRWIEVDFSNWSISDYETFEKLKLSILEKRIIEFDYYSSFGEKTRRRVQPLQLWFKHRAWYLRAFCLGRMDERLFKLTRLKRLVLTDESFDKQISIAPPEIPENNHAHPLVTIRIKIEESQLYRIFDEFDENSIVKNPDGSYTAEATFPEDEWVYGYILSFGHFAEVLEPPRLREIIKARLQKNLENYN